MLLTQFDQPDQQQEAKLVKTRPTTDTEQSVADRTISLLELPGVLDARTWRLVGVWTVVSLLTSGIPASLEMLLYKTTISSLSLGFDELFLQTAPLLLSVAAVAFACHRRWLDNGGALPAAWIILFGGWLGLSLQHRGGVVPVDWFPTDQYGLLGSVIFAALNLLGAYLLAYGIGACVASILVGCVIGVGWSHGLSQLQLQQQWTALNRQQVSTSFADVAQQPETAQATHNHEKTVSSHSPADRNAA